MPDSDGGRLWIYIRLQSNPRVIEIEFPSKELARKYRDSLDEDKEIAEDRDSGSTVAIKLPRSAVELEMSRSMGGFIIHFSDEHKARDWADAIFIPVKEHRKRLLVKQYWSGDELAAAMGRLRAVDRAGTPPGESRRSRKEI